jgi:putative membrane protein
MKSKKSRFLLFGVLAALLPVSAAHAAQDSASAWHPTTFFEAVIASIVFGAVGIVLAVGGFKLFDLVTPFNLEREMCQNKNIAVGILCGAIVIGVCHIIAASMS